MGEAFLSVLALQHLIALEMCGWDGVSPRGDGRSSSRAGGGCCKGFGCNMVCSRERGLRWSFCTWDPQMATKISHVSL